MSRDRLLAGVDIGTLTCRLLIAQVSDAGRLNEIHSERRILRLGEGVDRTRLLSEKAMDRVIVTLKEWRQVIDSHQVTAMTAVATSAVREATNRGEFLDRVKREAGFEVEIITGEEEARRTLLGIRSGLPVRVTDMLALDIGGGSTEFILDRPGRSSIVRSIDMGVVRLTEQCLAHDPPTDEELNRARGLVRRDTEAAYAALGDFREVMLVGTAGTITTLAAMAQRLPVYEPARIHNYQLSLAKIHEIEQEVFSRTRVQRCGMPGLEAGREDVIVAGTIILRAVMETLGYSECLVSDLGLREGVLIDLVNRAIKR
ncbi:MAG: Ppx/GppA phosphatase family protein [Nitrospiraceae bacterium]